MKYELGIKILISFLIGGIAVLYKFQLNPGVNTSEVSSIIHVPRKFLFDVLTNVENIPKYFSWITKFRAEDGRRDISMGKWYQFRNKYYLTLFKKICKNFSYKGLINMPFLGQHEIKYKIKEIQAGNWVILGPQDIKSSYFNTEIVLMLNSISKDQTQFHMKIIYKRTSALFQLTFGKFLKMLTDEHLNKTEINVRELANSHWIQRQKSKASRQKPGKNDETHDSLAIKHKKASIINATTTGDKSSKNKKKGKNKEEKPKRTVWEL